MAKAVGLETLLRAADAAGFAMASDDEVSGRRTAAATASHAELPSGAPRQALVPLGATKATIVGWSIRGWMREAATAVFRRIPA